MDIILASGFRKLPWMKNFYLNIQHWRKFSCLEVLPYTKLESAIISSSTLWIYAKLFHIDSLVDVWKLSFPKNLSFLKLKKSGFPHYTYILYGLISFFTVLIPLLWVRFCLPEFPFKMYPELNNTLRVRPDTENVKNLPPFFSLT